ncbi:MAG: hypothetical protein ABW208_26025 [Pyrinomonadaceae bacterium]
MHRLIRLLYAACLALCLSLTFAQESQARQDDEHKAEAIRFLASREPQLATAERSNKLYLLLNLTPAALYAGESAKAAAYAQELLALGEQLKTRPGNGPGMYGDAVHVGNLVLGRLALLNGDVDKAREHLLASGRVPGLPVLKSFGPNMRLARELIEKGERDAAVEYLDLCAKFWENEGGRLAGWKAVIKDGGMPNFGPNLGVQLISWRFAK